MKKTSRLLLRAAVGAVLFLALGGPGAGNVGGCGNSPPEMDAADHCRARQDISCRRDLFAGRSTQTQFAECIALIEPVCSGATWPTSCNPKPSPADSDACIRLLARSDLVTVETGVLLSRPECNLCGSAP